MTMRDYEKARQFIADAGGGDFEGPKPESLVVKAELTLGIQFPPTYRRFLLELGCGNINGSEILGLVDDNFQNSAVPNGIWLTLHERTSSGLGPAYVIIGETGDGGYYALDTGQRDSDEESPVVVVSVDGHQCGRIAATFGTYLLNTLARLHLHTNAGDIC